MSFYILLLQHRLLLVNENTYDVTSVLATVSRLSKQIMILGIEFCYEASYFLSSVNFLVLMGTKAGKITTGHTEN